MATGDDDDDDFDMFAPFSSAPSTSSKAASGPNNPARPQQHNTGLQRTEDMKDSEGYLRAPPGTMLYNSKYTVKGQLGSGVFSTVFLVTSNKENDVSSDSPRLFAAKVSRANETMYKAGMKELDMLRKIKGHPHLVSLVESFEMESNSSNDFPHLVLVFEKFGLNLRETLNKFGSNVGISMGAVRSFGRQLFAALGFLRERGIVHADFKPDNILVSDDFKRVVLSDFGSALNVSEPKQPTPYLVSRYYRAPEVVLGFEDFGCEIDVWALGCTLFELYSGTLLFPGRTNNDMLDMFQVRIGKFPTAMIKRHVMTYENKLELEAHFDLSSSEIRFKRHETDPVTQKIVRRLVKFTEDRATGKESLRALAVKHVSEEDGLSEDVLDLVECLERCLMLDSKQRIDPREALSKLKFLNVAPPAASKRIKMETG